MPGVCLTCWSRPATHPRLVLVGPKVCTGHVREPLHFFKKNRTVLCRYVEFRLRIGRRFLGRYTLVTSIGGRFASNHFSQTFEFDVSDPSLV